MPRTFRPSRSGSASRTHEPRAAGTRASRSFRGYVESTSCRQGPRPTGETRQPQKEPMLSSILTATVGRGHLEDVVARYLRQHADDIEIIIVVDDPALERSTVLARLRPD